MVENTILRMPQVEAACGLKKSAIYKRIKAGEFPTPVSLGSKHIGFLSQDIQIWINNRPRIGNIEGAA